MLITRDDFEEIILATGWTRSELARRIGISHVYLGHLIRGLRNNPGLDVAISALNVCRSDDRLDAVARKIEQRIKAETGL